MRFPVGGWHARIAQAGGYRHPRCAVINEAAEMRARARAAQCAQRLPFRSRFRARQHRGARRAALAAGGGGARVGYGDARALATRSLDLGYAELERLNVDERHWERRGQQLFELRETWRRGGVLAMLHRFLHVFDLPARLLQSPGGERALTNLLHLAELLQQAAATIEGEQALIRHLAERIADYLQPSWRRPGRPPGKRRRPGQGRDDPQVEGTGISPGVPAVRLCLGWRSRGPGLPLSRCRRCAAGTARRQSRWRRRARARGQGSGRACGAAGRPALALCCDDACASCLLGRCGACLPHNPAKKPQLHRGAFGHVLGGGREIDNGAIEGLLRELADGHPSIAVEYMPALARAALPAGHAGRTAPAGARTPSRPCRSVVDRQL